MQLPERPNLRHLRDQAKDLARAGKAKSITDAQFQVARSYGFASWVKLKEHVESLADAGLLKRAIDENDLESVKDLMTRNPELHRAPLGYAKNGPLTWVAECRVPWGPPTPARLQMAAWMIANGSDVHQGGDGPLARASLNGDRIEMMELLVAHGADVNALWNGAWPILFSPCETVDPVTLQWLLDHGADPNCPGLRGRMTALDYLTATYVRSAEMPACIELLLEHGARTKYDHPGVLAVLRNRMDLLEQALDERERLVHWRFAPLDIGNSGTRRLLLTGATLLHVAAEFGNLDAAKLLLERGADVDGRAWVDAEGVGGQTPIFHAVTQFGDAGLPMVRLLVEHGADLTVRVKLPGHYERLSEVVECTPLEYAVRFPGEEAPGTNAGTIGLLRSL